MRRSGMKIYGAENKRIKVILYSVSSAVHCCWTDNKKFDLWIMFIMYFLAWNRTVFYRRRNLVSVESGPRFAWHTHGTRNRCQKKWRRFMAPVSGACVMGISVHIRSEKLTLYVNKNYRFTSKNSKVRDTRSVTAVTQSSITKCIKTVRNQRA